MIIAFFFLLAVAAVVFAAIARGMSRPQREREELALPEAWRAGDQMLARQTVAEQPEHHDVQVNDRLRPSPACFVDTDENGDPRMIALGATRPNLRRARGGER